MVPRCKTAPFGPSHGCLAFSRRLFKRSLTCASSLATKSPPTPAVIPSSRAFYLQWLKAQRQSDDYFASLYGGDHFISVQQQANLQRAQNGADNAAQVTKSSN